MYSKSLKQVKPRPNLRLLRLVLAGIALLVSIGLTSCQTAQARTDNTALEILIAEIPKYPTLPSWPNVYWAYEDGKYYLNEEDVDKVLDYLENQIPLYQFEVTQYEEQLDIVLDGLRAL
jgi:hypothetical protein